MVTPPASLLHRHNARAKTTTGLVAPPPALGALTNLEALQADGNALAPPLDLLYRRDPLLLVALSNASTRSLDLSDVGAARGAAAGGVVGGSEGRDACKPRATACAISLPCAPP